MFSARLEPYLRTSNKNQLFTLRNCIKITSWTTSWTLPSVASSVASALSSVINVTLPSVASALSSVISVALVRHYLVLGTTISDGCTCLFWALSCCHGCTRV